MKQQCCVKQQRENVKYTWQQFFLSICLLFSPILSPFMQFFRYFYFYLYSIRYFIKMRKKRNIYDTKKNYYLFIKKEIKRIRYSEDMRRSHFNVGGLQKITVSSLRFLFNTSANHQKLEYLNLRCITAYLLFVFKCKVFYLR